MKGLFLGAGASYEVGMPLVWEFSNTLRVNVLKRLDSKLFNFKSDTSLKDSLISLLSDEKMHYEEVVGELEKLYIVSRGGNTPIHGVMLQLIACIQILLLEEQGNVIKMLGEKIKDYYGLCSLVRSQGVLNVFSLNHDIVFEEICDYHNIPFRDGFFPEENNYKNVANFKVVTKNQLGSGEINLFKSGENGINLFKLHGSLDIFAAEDKSLFLKSSGNGDGVGSHFREIKKIEDHNLEICKHGGVRATNELCIYDNNNELQFLRRSLLSGAHKFQERFEQIAPIAFFEAFKKHLSCLSELIIIGYGFGDSHINEVLCLWMTDKSNNIIIYDPYRSNIPDCLSDFSDQIEIVNGGMTDFFLSIDSSKENIASKAERKILSMIREKLKDNRRLAK